jgi:hypothetical protein
LVLAGSPEREEVTVPVTSRRGKPIECHVSISPLRAGDRSVGGAILLMEERGAE